MLHNYDISNIKAKAIVREYPQNAFPLKVSGKYAHSNTLLMTTDGIVPILPVNEINNTNVIVVDARTLIGDILISEKSDGLSIIKVGSGTTAPTSNDIDVETVISSTKQYTYRYRISGIITISTFFSSVDNNGTWGNAGLFGGNSLYSAQMFCHSTFSPTVSKTSANTQTLDFDVTIQ